MLVFAYIYVMLNTEIYTHISRKNLGKIVSPIDTINLNKRGGIVCSSGSISAPSADITPKWYHINTKGADINKLSEMPAAALKRFKTENEIK